VTAGQLKISSTNEIRNSSVRPRQIVTHSAEQTIQAGRELAGELPAACLILLEGELGSGKTTFAKGIVAGLGAEREEMVTSPTFTLVHEYGKQRKVFHADLYRVEGARELETLGLDDLIDQDSMLIVEWGEKLGPGGSQNQIRISFEMLGGDDRRITIDLL
jgi:tRNA threonylcarbamoyladenosine biosynthesis protein TsaE